MHATRSYRPRSRRTAATLLIAGMLATPVAHAACGIGAPAITLAVDNDSLALQRKDGGYTSGVRIDAYGAAGAVQLPGEALLAGLMRSGLAGDCRTASGQSALGGWWLYQAIFTPRDLQNPGPQPSDRPWAGHLQIGRSLEVLGRSGNADVSRRLEWAIGSTGRGSAAEASQKFVHRITGYNEPKGWDNQIGDRITGALSYVERRRWGGQGSDLVGHWGATLGTAQSSLQLGAMVRTGRGLCTLVAPGTGVGAARFSGDGAPADCREGVAAPRYLFAAVDLRGKGNDLLIEGTPRVGGNDARLKRWVGDLRVGATVSYAGATLTYAFTRRSADFSVPGASGPPQNFGTLTIEY